MVIATIPIRVKMLRKALASVVLQTYQAAAIVIETTMSTRARRRRRTGA